jgi:hypothetical protein
MKPPALVPQWLPALATQKAGKVHKLPYRAADRLHSAIDRRIIMRRELIVESRPAPIASALAFALGGAAFGAIAIGALAIGRVAIDRVVVKRARFGKLEVDELTVRKLHVVENS